MTYNSLTIIPNELYIKFPMLHKKSRVYYHQNLLEEIIHEYNLPINPDKNELLKIGSIIISTSGDYINCEVPDRITVNQYRMLYNLMGYIKSFTKFMARIVEEENTTVYQAEGENIKETINIFYEHIRTLPKERGITR